MSTKTFLRAAAVVAFIQCAAHGFLLLSYEPSHGPDEVRLVQAMRSFRFDFGGSQPHSYWEMYIGYGLFAAVNCLIEALLFWWASRHTAGARGLVNAIIGIFLFANITYGALVWRYFFFIPLVMDTLVALCLAAAFLAGRTTQSAVARA